VLSLNAGFIILLPNPFVNPFSAFFFNFFILPHVVFYLNVCILHVVVFPVLGSSLGQIPFVKK